MAVHDLRRPTNFPSGIAAGGASTDFDIQPQPVDLTVSMKLTAKTVALPAGTVLIAKIMYPDPVSPSTTGDYAINRVTGGDQAELAASAAETPLNTLYSPLKQITVDTVYTITPTNSPDGTTHVGFRVILPRIRS